MSSARIFSSGATLVARDRDLADVILRSFHRSDDDELILPLDALAPDFLDLDVDVAVVLVPFADRIDVLLQLRFIEAS